jgi:hypothetical protein
VRPKSAHALAQFQGSPSLAAADQERHEARAQAPHDPSDTFTFTLTDWEEKVSQISVRTVLAANGTALALQGTQYEFLPQGMFPRGALVEFASLTDATGVLRTVQTGSDVVEEESPVALGTINVQPLYPDNFTLNDLVAPGERINLKLRDTSGAQRIVMTMVRFTAL